MTKAWVATEVCVGKSVSGGYEASHDSVCYFALTPYLSLCEEVVLVARSCRGTRGPVVTGPGVAVLELPFYRGVRGLMRVMPQIARTLWRCGKRGDYIIVRLPEVLSFLLGLRALLGDMRLISIVVADSDGVYGRAFKKWPSYLIKPVARRLVRLLLDRSDAVVYVTERWLQRKYPPPRSAPVFTRSSVLLSESAFRRRPNVTQTVSPFGVFSMGAMTSDMKGFDLLIRAVGRLVGQGRDITLALAGEGAGMSQLLTLAEELGLSGRVRFLGHISDVGMLRQLMDTADCYASASRTEGLPRAVIEAMARSLPVVATNVGGTGELVGSPWLIPPEDVDALADAISMLIDNTSLANEAGQANYSRARAIQSVADPARYKSFLAGLAGRGC